MDMIKGTIWGITFSLILWAILIATFINIPWSSLGPRLSQQFQVLQQPVRSGHAQSEATKEIPSTHAHSADAVVTEVSR
jgi:hypothetical protein